MDRREFVTWLTSLGLSPVFISFLSRKRSGFITSADGTTRGDTYEKTYLTLDPFQAGKLVRESEIEDGKIKIGGQWVEICRTDLMDDISTGGRKWTREQVTSMTDSHGRLGYGARMTKDYFAIIDAFSDG
jgi:hypothetical protein